MGQAAEAVVVPELRYACFVRGRRIVDVIRATPGRAPPGRHYVEVEIMDRWRSYGVVAGVLERGELRLLGGAVLPLAGLRDGAYWCVAYLPPWDLERP